MTSESNRSPDFPAGYVPFASALETLPDPSRIEVATSVELETLHLPGPNPTIVFVHGGLGSLWNPYPQLAAVNGDRGLVSYSLAGNGRSTSRSNQTLESHVADLGALLDALGVDRPIIHGHSYGTAIAIEYAKRHSVGGLVLHAGGDHDLTPAWEKPLLRLFLALRLYRLPMNDEFIRQLAYRVGFHEMTPEAIVEDFLRSNPMPRRRSAWETVTDAFWGYDGRGDMDRIDVPTLVIHGPADGIVPLDVGKATAGRIQDSVFCRLEGTGHVAMIERPAVYNELLRSVVDTVCDGGSLVASIRERVGAEESPE